jgi:hypothetical protein
MSSDPKTLADLYYAHDYNTFVKQMTNMAGKEKVDEFLEFHTGQVLNDLVILWPIPSIWEVWNTWPRRKNLQKVRESKTTVYLYEHDNTYTTVYL